MMATDAVATIEFVPGGYWTPERAKAAADAVSASFEAVRALTDAAAEEASNAHTGVPFQTPWTPERRIPAHELVVRRGEPRDVPRLAELILGADLPPLFIEEFVAGFVVVEHQGTVIAGAGGEPYEDTAVVRSVVVDRPARGLGLGRVMSDLVIADLRLAGARDIYLVTVDARPFWEHMGFADAPLETWRGPARISWQHRYLIEHLDMVETVGIHAMAKRV
jgi:amino-acid N-acetyltransferase